MAILDRCLYLAQSGITPEDFKKLVLKNMAISFALFLPLFLSSILLLFRLVPIRLPDVIPISLLVVSFVPLVASVILSFKPLLDGYIEIKQIERELPFVSAVLTLYAVSGMPPHVALNRFSTFQEVFPSTARMATRIEKLKQLFVLDDFAAIKKEAEIIGSDSVQDVLLSAIGTTRTGADLYVILRDKMRSSFTMLKESFVRLSETMKTMADVILILFGILPMMLFTMFSMFYSDTTLAQLRVYSFFFNPLMGIVVIAMVDSLYPKTPISYNKIYKRLLYWIPASLALSIVTWLMFQLVLNRVEYFSMYAITMTLFVGSFSLFFAEGLRFYREIKRLNRIDNFLPTFVRDITEEVKRGVSPTIAIRSILEVKSYGKELDDILQKISSGISSGLSLEDAVMQVKSKLSWNGLIIFKLFYEASRFGGSGEVFEEFSDVVRELADSNKALKKGISPLRSFGIMTLFLIIFVTGMLVRLIVVPMSSYAEILSEVSTKGGGFLLGLKLIKPEALPGFIDLVFSGLMVNAILLGLITGKMVEGKIGIGFIYVAIYLLISMMAMFGIMLGVSIK